MTGAIISVHCLAVFCLCHLHRFPSGHRQKISLFVCPFHQYGSSCWWKCRRASDSWRLASSCDRDHDSNLESFHTTFVSSQKSHAVSKTSTLTMKRALSESLRPEAVFWFFSLVACCLSLSFFHVLHSFLTRYLINLCPC